MNLLFVLSYRALDMHIMTSWVISAFLVFRLAFLQVCIVLASHPCTRVLHGQLSKLHTLKSSKNSLIFMGNSIKKGILHTLKFFLHTMSCRFWLNLCRCVIFKFITSEATCKFWKLHFLFFIINLKFYHIRSIYEEFWCNLQEVLLALSQWS